MTLELKEYPDWLNNYNKNPYKLGGVKNITNDTIYGDGHFATTIFDTRVFLTNCFEYVKNADTDEYFVKDGKWIKDE